MCRYHQSEFWQSNDTKLLLNPRLPQTITNELTALYKHYQDSLKGHVFLGTSGTTHLKLVALKKSAFLISAKAVNEQIQANKIDTWINPLPTFHVGGLSISARAMLSNSNVVQLTRWDPSIFISKIKHHHATLTSLVPTQLFDLIQQSHPCPDSIRYVFIGGAAISESLQSQAIQLGWPIHSCYGMTETTSQIMVNGQVYPHVEVNIDPESHRLAIKSKCLFTCYCLNSNGQPTKVDPKVNEWFLTEDLATKENNRIIIQGRQQDTIKISGELVRLHRVNLLLDDAKVQTYFNGDAYIQAQQDNRLGHTLRLISTSNDVKKLIDSYHQHCLPFERIKSIQYVKKISKTATGKYKTTKS